MSDGSYKLIQYSYPVHYLSKNEYLEINNSLEKKTINGKDVYENTSNAFNVRFETESESSKSVNIQLDKYKLNWNIRLDGKSVNKDLTTEVSNKKEGVQNSGTLLQKNIFSGVNLEYIVNGNQIKENIIINSAQDNYQYTYDIETENLYLCVENGEIIAYASDTSEKIYTIPAAYMYDNNNQFSKDIKYELTDNGKCNYTLSIIPNAEWLADSARAYPIVIDPIVTIGNSNVYSLCPGYSRGFAARTIGETYVKFDLPNLPKGASVTYANFCFHIMKGDTVTSDDTYIYAKEVSAYWDESVGLENARLSAVGALVFAALHFDANTEENTLFPVSINLTSQFIKWTGVNPQTQYGIQLIADPYGVNVNDMLTMASENYWSSLSEYRPYLEILYRTNIGLEDYWSYETFDVGRAGTGYVNLYNNQLTYIHNDISLVGELPISLNHIYNDAWIGENYNINNLYSNMRFGLGWKINYQQAIFQVTTDTYCYVDADGTYHNLDYSSGVYQDVDGLGLILSIDNNSTNARYILTDKTNNKLMFEIGGRLMRIEDSNGNFNQMTYDASWRLVEITDRDNRSVTLEYNQYNYLVFIRYQEDANGVNQKSISLWYQGIALYRFTYADGKMTYFLCDSTTNGKLKMAFNYDGYAVSFDSKVVSSLGYENAGYPNVRTIKKYIISLADSYSVINGTYNITETGQTNEIVFYNNYTVKLYAKYNDHFYFYQENITNYFKNNITEYYEYDNEGRIYHNYQIDNNEVISSLYYYGEEGDDMNKVISYTSYNSSLQNYIKNGSFENETNNWTSYSSYDYIGLQGTTSAEFSVGRNSYYVYIPQLCYGSSSLSQSVNLTIGTYTLSGLIKVQDGMIGCSFNNYGARLCVRDDSTFIAKTDTITGEISHVNKGFIEVYCTFNITVTGDYDICFDVYNCMGTVWFDGVNLIKSDRPSVAPYNQIDNGGFENNNFNGWTIYGLIAGDNSVRAEICSSADDRNAQFGDYKALITTYSFKEVSIVKTINAQKLTDGDYIISAWAMTYIWGGASYINQIKVELLNSAGTVIEGGGTYNFYHYNEIWEEAVIAFNKTASVYTIRITIAFNCFVGAVCYDNVQLYNINVINYQYNEYGMVEEKKGADGLTYYTNISDTQTTKTFNYYKEAGNNDVLISSTVLNPTNYNVVYTFDNITGIKNSYTYDEYGRITSTIINNANVTTSPTIYSYNTYSSINSNFEQTVTSVNSRGFSAISTYDAFYGMLKNDVNALDNYNIYTYNNNSQLLTTITLYNNSSVVVSAVNYTYDTNYRLTRISYGNTYYDYTYDAWGNVLTVSVNGTLLTTYSYINNSHTYSNNNVTLQTSNKVLESITRGSEIINYTYDSQGNIVEIKKDNNTNYVIKYSYDLSGKLVTEYDSVTGKTDYYKYDELDRLISISEYSGSAQELNQNITRVTEIYYDIYSRPIQINTIITNDSHFYADVITSSHSSDSHSLKYSFNKIIKYRELTGYKYYVIPQYANRVTYTYNTAGYMTRQDNEYYITSQFPNGATFVYVRDVNNNLTAIKVYSYGITTGNPTITITSNSVKYSQKYTYASTTTPDTNISSVTVNGDTTYTYDYDDLHRVESRTTSVSNTAVVTEAYTYLNGMVYQGVTSSTYYVETKTVNGTTWTLSYDALGRVTQMSQTGVENPWQYYYNDKGELIRENNPIAGSIKYTYGSNGNITGKQYYSYTLGNTNISDPTEIVTMTYPASDWTDKLTGYNGSGVTYTGNDMYTWNGWTYGWANGMLASAIKTGTTSASYAYDMSDLRISKTVDSVVTTYTYEGSRLIREQRTNVDIWYLYNDNGTKIGLKYNGNNYYYITNPLGDVVGIVDAAGSSVVSYTYDAWGNHTVLNPDGTANTSSTFIGNINPIRYRGYYFDTETGLYYLNARYYSPELCRFISADSIETDNLYAYCSNDPINNSDASGYGKTWDWFVSKVQQFAGYYANTKRAEMSVIESISEQTYYTDVSIALPTPTGLCFKFGLTFVFNQDQMELYFHEGLTTTPGTSHSFGIIPNYQGENSYSGWFYGAAYSKGIGMEAAINPDPNADVNVGSMGVSIGTPGASMTVDYYKRICIWRRR